MDSSFTQEAGSQKSLVASSINSNPFSSSMSKISGCSREISCSKKINFYLNFEDSKNPLQETSKKFQLILKSMGIEKLLGKIQMGFLKDDLEYNEVYNCLVKIMNHVSVDEFKKSKHKEQRLISLTDDSKDHLVNLTKEKVIEKDLLVNNNCGKNGVNSSSVKIVPLDDKAIGTQRPKLSFQHEFKESKHKEQRQISLTDNANVHLVNLTKEKVIEKDLLVNNSNRNIDANYSSVKIVPMDDKAIIGTQKPKLSFHMNWIPKPQDEYKILVNNVNQPFQHVWLQTTKDGSRFIHPLEKLSVHDFIDKYVSKTTPKKPPPVETTPFKLVEDVKDLKELVAKLHGVNEFAVDLEHNQYRSYQGLTCLMQISTRTEDFIVDTLKLRVHIGPYMRDIFRDPTKRKVMHGADKDILWLQRDFGIYVCNMFDTGQASRVLKMERNRLDYLLLYFCGVIANKEYQTADWRFRPLTDEMLRYAREDTHYLLYIYDLMKKRLLSSSTDPNHPDALLVEVYQRSYDVCMQLYQKEILTEYSYLNIYGLHEADLNGQQLSIVAALCEWRDIVARAEDESTGYVLPNKILIEIAKKMPMTIEILRGMLTSNHPHIERNLTSIVSIVQNSIYNAADFEGIARRLKEEYLEMVGHHMEAEKDEQKMFEEACTNGVTGANSCINIVASQSMDKAGSVLHGVNRNYHVGAGSSVDGGNWNPMNRSGFTNTKIMNRGESFGVQKNPSGGFRAVHGGVAGNKKPDLETKLQQMNHPFNFPSRAFKDKHQTQKEANVKWSKSEQGVVLPEYGSGTPEKKRGNAIDLRAANGVIPSGFKKSVQTSKGTAMMKQSEGGNKGYVAARKEVSLKEDKDDVNKVKPEKWIMKRPVGGCKDGASDGSGEFAGWVGGARPFMGIKVPPRTRPRLGTDGPN